MFASSSSATASSFFPLGRTAVAQFRCFDTCYGTMPLAQIYSLSCNITSSCILAFRLIWYSYVAAFTGWPFIAASNFLLNNPLRLGLFLALVAPLKLVSHALRV